MRQGLCYIEAADTSTGMVFRGHLATQTNFVLPTPRPHYCPNRLQSLTRKAREEPPEALCWINRPACISWRGPVRNSPRAICGRHSRKAIRELARFSRPWPSSAAGDTTATAARSSARRSGQKLMTAASGAFSRRQCLAPKLLRKRHAD